MTYFGGQMQVVVNPRGPKVLNTIGSLRSQKLEILESAVTGVRIRTLWLVDVFFCKSEQMLWYRKHVPFKVHSTEILMLKTAWGGKLTYWMQNLWVICEFIVPRGSRLTAYRLCIIHSIILHVIWRPLGSNFLLRPQRFRLLIGCIKIQKNRKSVKLRLVAQGIKWSSWSTDF
jgi:hypothetical protein